MTTRYTGHTLIKANSDLDAIVAANAAAIAAATAAASWFGHAALNVKASPFNAVGNGVADDSVAILAAIAAVTGATATSRAVYFPAGTYKVSQKIVFPSNITVYGEGAASIVTGTLTDTMFEAVGKDNVVVHDLTLSGTFSAGVHINGGTGHRVLFCDISGATIHGTLGGSAAVLFRDTKKSIAHGNTCHGNGDGVLDTSFDIAMVGGFDVTTNADCEFTNNKCLSTTADTNLGLFNAKRCKVSGNECTGAVIVDVTHAHGGYGILFYNSTTVAPYDVCYDNIVNGNTVHDTQGTGIYLQRCRNSTVSVNILHGTSTLQGDATLSTAAIVDDGGTGNVIDANVIYACTKHGISVVGGGGPQSINLSAVVTANQIDGTLVNFHAICIRGTPADALVAVNNITNCAGEAIAEFANEGSIRVTVAGNILHTLATYGVWARAASVDWTIVNNVLSDLTTPSVAIVDQGANNAVWGNRIQGSLVFQAPTLASRVALSGDARVANPQLQLGTSNGYGAVGARVSGGDVYIATNATQTATASGDLWTQTDATFASRLWVLQVAGDADFFIAAIGHGAGTFAAFWGTAKVSLMAAGGLKVTGTQVVGTRQPAIADIATADATDLATAIALVNVCKAKINTELATLRSHGLIAP